MRLNKFIATNSKYSRRKADELITLKQVTINGKTANLGSQVDPENDAVKVNGKQITSSKTKVYYALHKPKGYITTRSDEHDRKTVMDLMPKIPNLKPVGRLDMETEGLLLLSNDGEFINKITHPKYECEKEYFVIIKGTLTEAEQKKLRNGIRIDGKKTSPAKLSIIKEDESTTTLTLKIHEGRNRQIRKMFAQIKHYVKYLQRTAIGKIKLGNLKKGAYRKLTTNEANAY